MNEISLQQHLATLGWDFKYLNHDGSIARVGRSQGQPCFEPFGAIRRVLDDNRLPIHHALKVGTKLMFLPSLKFDVLPNPSLWYCITHPLTGLFGLVALVTTKLAGQNVSDFQNMPQLQGDVEMFTNPPFSEFPFGQTLTVKGIDGYAVALACENGVCWTLPPISFATVKQITVLKP